MKNTEVHKNWLPAFLEIKAELHEQNLSPEEFQKELARCTPEQVSADIYEMRETVIKNSKEENFKLAQGWRERILIDFAFD